MELSVSLKTSSSPICCVLRNTNTSVYYGYILLTENPLRYITKVHRLSNINFSRASAHNINKLRSFPLINVRINYCPKHCFIYARDART